MEGFITKQEERLYRALEQLITNCVDSIGTPKTPTVNQLRNAKKALINYEKYEASVYAKTKTFTNESK